MVESFAALALAVSTASLVSMAPGGENAFMDNYGRVRRVRRVAGVLCPNGPASKWIVHCSADARSHHRDFDCHFLLVDGGAQVVVS